MMTTEKDIFGNPTDTDIQGNTKEKSIFGDRPKDAQGNTEKDIFGNEIAQESEEE